MLLRNQVLVEIKPRGSAQPCHAKHNRISSTSSKNVPSQFFLQPSLPIPSSMLPSAVGESVTGPIQVQIGVWLFDPRAFPASLLTSQVQSNHSHTISSSVPILQAHTVHEPPSPRRKSSQFTHLDFSHDPSSVGTVPSSSPAQTQCSNCPSFPFEPESSSWEEQEHAWFVMRFT